MLAPGSTETSSFVADIDGINLTSPVPPPPLPAGVPRPISLGPWWLLARATRVFRRAVA